MGIEPNSDRMWNAIGGIVIAGAIIGALTLLVSSKGGLMDTMTEKMKTFMSTGFNNGMSPTPKP